MRQRKAHHIRLRKRIKSLAYAVCVRYRPVLVKRIALSVYSFSTRRDKFTAQLPKCLKHKIVVLHSLSLISRCMLKFRCEPKSLFLQIRHPPQIKMLEQKHYIIIIFVKVCHTILLSSLSVFLNPER